MLSTNTIDQVKEVQLSQIIRHYVTDLKLKGVNYQACCPFHGEKSPSFVVSDVKGIYKCFGCGVSGNAISFVMGHKNLQFVDACKTIAEICGITIEYEKKEYSDQEKAIFSAAQLQEQVLNLVVPIMQKALHNLPDNHPAKIWLADRHMTTEHIQDWQIGWCPEDWRFVTPTLIERGLYEPAIKLGIVKTNAEKNNHYDGYRSRIIFPIQDGNGKFIGLGGRYIRINENDGKDIPKYINPTDCELYNKSTVLYGLNRATKAIKDAGQANVVEGYMDVITPHLVGIANTVATCGTAFTDRQMKLLKKHTSHVMMWRDTDSAGMASFRKAVPELLKHEFKVSQAIYSEKDPDDYCQKLFSPNGCAITCLDKPIQTDAVHFYANEMYEAACDDIHSQAEAKADILKLISNIGNDIIRTNYLDSFTKKYKWKASDTKKQFTVIFDEKPLKFYDGEDDNDDGGIKWAAWVSDEQKEEVMRKGYLACNKKDEKGRPLVGYFTFGQNGKTEITNFIVNPLFRIEAGQESRYLSEINNGYVNGVIDMPAKVFPSAEQFQGMCVAAAGAFMIFGSKLQWQRIAVDLLHQYPVCIEVNALGWHKRGGFFAFVEQVYKPNQSLMTLDKWGIVTIDDKNYLIPAGSEAYKKLQSMDKDVYENLRFLTYRKSPVTFQQWAAQMQRVYGQKGIVGIAYAVLTMFKDVVFDVDNNCPHLYAFGEPSSGKSKWAESITAIFFYRRAALNLNSGTDFAFFNFMSIFTNCPAHLNEFDIEVIKQEWFQAIKGAFDGEGRERGKIGAKNATEIQRVNSTLILTGQKLVTADDNSVVTRSIIEAFSTNNDRTEDDKKAYDDLKDWERMGMNSMLLDVLAQRKNFEDNYKENFNKQLSHWRKNNPKTKDLNQRIVQNFCHLYTCYRMIDKVLPMPQDAPDFSNYCFDQAIKWSSFIRSSDTLSEFWRALEFLANGDSIVEGWDFIVKEETEVKVRISKAVEEVKKFNEPTKVLYLRLNNMHKLFQTTYRSRTGKEAMSLENLLHYFSSRKYYIGAIKQMQFKRFITKSESVQKAEGTNMVNKIESNRVEDKRITSCYAFVYEDLEIDITSEVAEIPELPFA